jgi:hypothetical protein
MYKVMAATGYFLDSRNYEPGAKGLLVQAKQIRSVRDTNVGNIFSLSCVNHESFYQLALTSFLTTDCGCE